MAKNYFGVVLTTKEHDKYRLVVYRYKDPGILNTSRCVSCFGPFTNSSRNTLKFTANIAAVSRLASGTSLAE